MGSGCYEGEPPQFSGYSALLVRWGRLGRGAAVAVAALAPPADPACSGPVSFRRHLIGSWIARPSGRPGLMAHQPTLGRRLSAVSAFHVFEQRLPFLLAGPRAADASLVPKRI